MVQGYTACAAPMQMLFYPGGGFPAAGGLQEQLRMTEPEGVLQGATTRGSTGCFGPKPPVMDPLHRCLFQLFALDAVLPVPPGAHRDTLLAAMRGRVLAKGDLVDTFQQPIKPMKKLDRLSRCCPCSTHPPTAFGRLRPHLSSVCDGSSA